MIVKGLEVEGFRGLNNASLTGFGGINILVGKAGCGKSSVLEALYIGLTLEDGLKYVMRRRGWFGLASARALFYHGRSDTRIKLILEDWLFKEVSITLSEPCIDDLPMLAKRGLNVRQLALLTVCTNLVKSANGKETLNLGTRRLYVDSDGNCEVLVPEEFKHKGKTNAVFIDWSSVYTYGTPEEVYSIMVQRGGEEAKRTVIEVLQEEFEDLRDLTILRVGEKWVLCLVFKDKALPYYVVSDGIRYALMYIMSVLTYNMSVILIEEPELHVHPGLMRIIADAIIDSYRKRKNQVFVTTHSLELIRMMLEEAIEFGLKDQDLKIYNLMLVNGNLYSREYTLDEAYSILRKIEWDLRM